MQYAAYFNTLHLILAQMGVGPPSSFARHRRQPSI